MTHYQFPLERLLQLRRHQRDLKRELLSAVIRRHADIGDEGLRMAAERRAQFDALRELGAAGPLDVSQSVARHAFAGRLAGALSDNEREQALAAQQMAACRRALVDADQSVKALEKLCEKRRAEFLAAVERREARALEDAWRAP